jgi:hypothetical protein
MRVSCIDNVFNFVIWKKILKKKKKKPFQASFWHFLKRRHPRKNQMAAV